MKQTYIFLDAIDGEGKPCLSHTDITIEHLFGNTNWTMITDVDDPMIVYFICGQCGQIRRYRKVTEKTLL